MEELFMANENNLKQTKSSFKFIGKVTRIDKDGAFKEETMTKGKMNGKTYRSLRFGVKTSPTNEMTVQMFDFEPDNVFMWNSEKKKADKNYKGDRMPFAQWEAQQDDLREQGYAVLQSRVGLTYGEDGKLVSQGLPSFVASQLIYENVNNGDSVVVEGTIRHSSYENREGKVVPQTNYQITKVFKIKDVDFDAPDFEEVTYFEEEVVFVGADIDKKEGKAYVTGRTIAYNGDFQDSQFVVNFKNEDGEGFDQGMVKLADAFKKKFNFGDVVNIFGDALNRVIVSEVQEEEEDEDDLLASLGGKSKPKHAQSFVSRTYISEMSIHGVDAWDKKVYKEDDFQKDELIADDKNPLSDELGGKNKKKGANPFDTDDDSIGEEDLPF
jgi:hypothetical protein